MRTKMPCNKQSKRPKGPQHRGPKLKLTLLLTELGVSLVVQTRNVGQQGIKQPALISAHQYNTL